ncbi:MAG: HAD family hydrolase [Candidatus Nanoarchaeia archaeon]
MIKGILFDFDGTIVDSEHSRYESSKQVLKEYGFDLTQQLWDTTYKSLSSQELFDDVIKQLLLEISSEELYQKAHTQRTQIENENGVRVIEGFREFYEECKKNNLQCVVCSGGTTEHVQRILKSCNIEIQGFGREEYEKRKPFPDAWLRGLELLGLNKDEVILFDDASSGIEAGLRAGIKKCCAINYGEEDFKHIEKIEQEVGVKTYQYFKNWKEVDIHKLIKC